MSDPMSKETAELQRLAGLPFHRSLGGYVRYSGPGWLQGAMTLGGGSAITSLTIGGVYGYEFLWVQPIAMIIGCIMLFALSHQTLSTGEKPFVAVSKHISHPLALAWALAALASSIIWGFSHYPLSAGMLEEIIEVTSGFSLKEGEESSRNLFLLGLAVLTWAMCAYTAWNYGAGGRAVKLFEGGIKILSTMIILSFAWMVFVATSNGQVQWGEVFNGLIPRSLPHDKASTTTVMAALGTAVGINMTFIYGYSQLYRGWGRSHRKLARYDIVLGLVIPYLLVTGLISVASASILYGSDMDVVGVLNPANAGSMFVSAGMGPVSGRLVFAFGVFGMAAGSLVMHMLCCGAAASEMFGWAQGSLKYRLALLAPTPAVLGVYLWSTMGPYVILPTSAIAGFLLPIAYIGFMILNNRKDYLGDSMPRGRRRMLFNTLMGLCITTVLASVCWTTAVRLGWM
jgi:manganese transport protein